MNRAGGVFRSSKEGKRGENIEQKCSQIYYGTRAEIEDYTQRQRTTGNMPTNYAISIATLCYIVPLHYGL